MISTRRVRHLEHSCRSTRPGDRHGRIRKLFGASAAASGLTLLAVILVLAEMPAPEPTLIIEDRVGEYLCEVRDGGCNAEAGYWPVDDVPERIAATVMAIEDRRMPFHPGVDPVAVIRAALQNLRNDDVISGASTLAMQIARLQRPAERTWPNKLFEMIRAVAMTCRHGRDRILGEYLKLAPYGNGIRGIGYAAYAYFGKPPEDLSWAEIAFLSAIPQQPNLMNPRTGAGRIRITKRARRIIETVRDRGWISPEEAERALRQVQELTLQPRLTQPPETIHLAIRFREIMEAERHRLPSSVTVLRTGFDIRLQRELADQASMCVDAWNDSGAGNAAVMVIDTESGAVVAAVGSTGYYDRDRCGAIDYTRIKRSPGSTLKPFLYAYAMENGIIDAESRLPDTAGFAGDFENFDGVWLGEIPVHRALAASRNIPAVELLRRTGTHRTYGCFADLGLHRYENTCERYGLGMAIGGLPVSMEDLVRAFTVFSCGGNLQGYKWYHQQVDCPSHRLFSLQTVQWINRALSDPMARLPSFPRMGNLEYEYPVAVKTGTSEGCRDAWTIAWSPHYLTAVWMGRPDGRPMRSVSGYRASAELARAVMDRLHGPDYIQMNDHRRRNLFPQSGDTVPADPPNPSPNLHEQLSSRVSPISIRILSPESGARYLLDPEVPGQFATISLTADIDPEPESVTWVVDGIPFLTVTHPYTANWRLIPGQHRISLRLPASGIESETIVVEVSGSAANQPVNSRAAL